MIPQKLQLPLNFKFRDLDKTLERVAGQLSERTSII